MRRSSILLGALLAAGCGGAGPYGYAREYAPLGSEETHLESASPIGYEDVRRSAADYAATSVGWFGVVTHVDAAESEQATVTLTYRTLQPRNLCADETASSCRVTVSDREGGVFTARVSLRPGDRAGHERVWRGSLVKVYGTPTGEVTEEGGPVIAVTWYRHWPHGTYVTTADAGHMRR